MLLALLTNLGMGGSPAAAALPTVSNAGFKGVDEMHKPDVFFAVLEGAEVSSPQAAPPAQHGKIYLKDNGAGKKQWVALFPSGAEQVMATEP